MSSAIKAVIQHEAALAQIDEMHRRQAARRFDVNTEKRRHRRRRRSLPAGVRRLRVALKGESA
jgi:hypothetical protein